MWENLETSSSKIVISQLEEGRFFPHNSPFCRWSFHSEDSDIAFAVYQKQGSELITIVPRDRVDCHMYCEEGEISCDETGVCKLSISDIRAVLFVN